MIQGVSKEVLTKESILQKCTEKQIYEFYWRPFKFGKMYESPFRKDPIPSFSIYATKNGTLRHHDFGNESMSGNCFSFVCAIKGVTLGTALEMINHDLCLGQGVYTPLIKSYVKRDTKINITVKNFTKEELEYWNRYSQDISDLKKNDVYSVDKLWINDFRIDIKGDICFAYLFKEDDKEYLKIYRPYAKERSEKWRYNGPNTLISGLDRVNLGGERIIIVGSKKEEMCIQKLTKDCCSTQNESSHAITAENIKLFQEKWKRRIIAWDPDEAGVEASTYYNQFNFGYVNVTKSLYKSGTKDWADMVSDYGMGTLQSYLKNKGVL